MDSLEFLPEEVLVHLFEFCGGRSLLKLSETCTTFNNIIFRETKLTKKIRLNVEFDYQTKLPNLSFEELEKIIADRKLSASKIVIAETEMLNEDGNSPTIVPMLKCLSLVTDDLIFECMTGLMDETVFKGMIQMFLPRLKRLIFDTMFWDWRLPRESDKRFPVEPVPEGFEYPLESLGIVDADTRLLRALSCCQNLKIFDCLIDHRIAGHANEALDEFLLKQRQLIQLSVYLQFWKYPLNVSPITEAWINMPFKLQILELSYVYAHHEAALIGFLGTQDQLKTLSVVFMKVPARRVMESICGLPALKEFRVNGPGVTVSQRFGCNIIRAVKSQLDALDGLSNRSVTFLMLVEASALTEKFIKIFESAPIFVCDGKLSNVHHEMLEKVTIKITWCTHFDYKPRTLNSRESFELDVLKFIQRHSKVLESVDIKVKPGQDESFDLSLEFCKSLVEKLPHLKRLSLKVAEGVDFKKFMKQNYPHIKMSFQGVKRKRNTT